MHTQEERVKIAVRSCTECGETKVTIEKLLTAQEAAEILGVDVSYIKNHCTRLKPYIPHVKLGGGRYGMRRFKPSQIAQFIERVLNKHNAVSNPDLDDILEADRWARQETQHLAAIRN